MNKVQISKQRKIPEKYQPVSLVPHGLLMFLWIISLTLPNIIYSGVMFADTLHIIKWTVTGVPIAVALIFAGYRIMRYGNIRLKLNLDLFGVIWLSILLYCGFMPLWVKIQSPTAYVLEMVCFASIWAFYVISYNSFPDYGLKTVIILANINAAVNTVFAELQDLAINDFSFLKGTIFAGLQKYSWIILPTPHNYIGNTAQQNMFGLWCAVAVLGAVYLFITYAKNISIRNIFLPAIFTALAAVVLKYAIINSSVILGVAAFLVIIASFVICREYYVSFILLLVAWNFWGLVNTTSRSASIALILGLAVIVVVSSWKIDRNSLIRFGAVIIVFSAVFYTSLYTMRSERIIEKTTEISQSAQTIGNRRGIWTTSAALFREHPEGVGIGQFKWHYLEGQRAGFKRVKDSWYRWQYTHWSHNEYLQFFCEAGWPGGIMLIIMWLTWLIPAIYGIFRRKTISRPALWAVSLVTLITFCAGFTRPFHRIENMVWMALAFALSNREFSTGRITFEALKSSMSRKVFGVMLIVSSVAGIVYISSGIYGNYVLRQALATQDERLQLYYLNEAAKHPIVREDALRNLGYHYIQVGEQTNDTDTLAKGFNILWEHFNREPRSEDISKLLSFAQRYQIEPVIREIASYFKPGDYHLQRVRQKDSDGNIINALLLVNGPGSDDK